jgi:hypothetical protein
LRNKRLLVLLVLAAAAAAAAVWLPAPAPQVVEAARTERRPQPKQAEGALASLPAREPIGRQAGELFSPQPWTASPSQSSSPSAPVEPPRPVAPPMPYRVAGQVSHNGATQVVLARGDLVITVDEGDTLDGGYRVEKIGEDRVTLIYLPLDLRQDLVMTSTLTVDAPPAAAQPAAQAAAGEQPAKLRWDGPKQVNAGSTFDVTLKLTSAAAVRAMPLQLSFDPNVLEAIAVRAGGFFSDGLFSYRVNPGGSIFVGASGKGEVANDAEFLIIRFKSIRPSADAELKVSSISLQGAGGRAIAHEQPAAFRTSVR